MIVYYVTTKANYDLILEKGSLVFKPDDEFENTECLKWACEQYKQKLNLQEDVYYLDRGSYSSDVEQQKEHCFADHLSVMMTLDIPESQYVLIKGDASHFFFSNRFVTLNEEEYDSDEFQVENDPDFQLRKMNWLRLYQPSLFYDENWADNEFVPFFHKICKEWIKDVQIFRGTEWKQWVGPDRVDPKTYPALEGFGDTLKINDKFIILGESELKTPFLLVGWELDKNGHYLVYYIDESSGYYISHAANTIFGNRRYKKA